MINCLASGSWAKNFVTGLLWLDVLFFSRGLEGVISDTPFHSYLRAYVHNFLCSKLWKITSFVNDIFYRFFVPFGGLLLAFLITEKSE